MAFYNIRGDEYKTNIHNNKMRGAEKKYRALQ